mgnify:CR=1 FL=1
MLLQSSLSLGSVRCGLNRGCAVGTRHTWSAVELEEVTCLHFRWVVVESAVDSYSAI